MRCRRWLKRRLMGRRKSLISNPSKRCSNEPKALPGVRSSTTIFRSTQQLARTLRKPRKRPQLASGPPNKDEKDPRIENRLTTRPVSVRSKSPLAQAPNQTEGYPFSSPILNRKTTKKSTKTWSSGSWSRAPRTSVFTKRLCNKRMRSVRNKEIRRKYQWS